MDISTVVNWIQIVLWLFAGWGFLARWFAPLANGKASRMKKILQSNWLLPILILIGFAMSTFSLRQEYVFKHSDLVFNDIPITQQQLVEDQTFQDEAVELDGKFFKNCTFRNVRLIYRGKAPFSFSHNEVNGFILDMRHPALQNMLHFLESGHFLNMPIQQAPNQKP